MITSSLKVKLHYRNYHPGLPIVAEGHNKLKCPNCSDFFFTNDTLETHLAHKHGVKLHDKNFCNKCKRTYKEQHNCPRDYKYPAPIGKLINIPYTMGPKKVALKLAQRFHEIFSSVFCCYNCLDLP